MDAEVILKLLDTYWFEKTILNNKKTPSKLHSKVDSIKGVEVLPLDPNFTVIPTLQVRSFSDKNSGNSTVIFFSDLSSRKSVLTPQKLRTISSEKEVREFQFPVESSENHEEKDIPTKEKLRHSHTRSRRPMKGKTSRSLSELEFMELKGFMDLGFVFSEEDKDSGLVSLIPGLQRLGREKDAWEGEEEEKNIDETLISKPYLSEAWGVLDQRVVRNPLLNWRMPAKGNEIDMKNNLRFWAQTVASIVR